MAIPRIGQEVIVEFLDGDIDQPIVTGRTYNASNLPPYDLPVSKTRTTIKSDTHKGDGFNELRFEDEAGKEEVYLHAQRDRREGVQNNSYHTIKGNQISAIGKNLRTTVNGQLFLNVKDHATQIYEDDKRTQISGSLRQSVGGSHSESVSDQYALNVGKTGSIQAGHHLKFEASRRLILTAGEEVELRAGAARLRLLSDGSISLQGTKARFSIEDLFEVLSKLVDIN